MGWRVRAASINLDVYSARSMGETRVSKLKQVSGLASCRPLMERAVKAALEQEGIIVADKSGEGPGSTTETIPYGEGRASCCYGLANRH